MRAIGTLLCAAIAGITVPASAGDLSPSAFFARCYGQITGQAIPRGYALAGQVRAGVVDPVDACMQVFNKGMLTANSTLPAGHADPEAVAVLNRFYNFHRSWFFTSKIEDIIDHGPDTGVGTADIYDATEPALALTYHMFMPGATYRDVLRDPQGFVAIRQENDFIRQILGFTVSMPNRRIYGNNTALDANVIEFHAANLPPNLAQAFDGVTHTEVQFVMPKIQVGDLIGILPQSQHFTIPNESLTPLGAFRFGEQEPGLNYAYDFYQSFGGGVLGQPIYLMMNFGHPKGLAMTGAEKLPRRWIYNSMQTFMCTQFPTLRAEDVTSFIDTSGTAPFRKSPSCLQCHGTMDQAAMTARNILPTGSEYNTVIGTTAKTTDSITSYRAEVAPIATWSATAVPNFHRMTPTGRLYFRSFSGQIVNQPVTGIGELGAAMSDTDDYYQCAAKRYFEFLTGLSVPLYDRSDPRYANINASLTEQDYQDRRFIESLGAQLKQTQSLAQLIRSIISSDYYKSSTFHPASQAGGQ